MNLKTKAAVEVGKMLAVSCIGVAIAMTIISTVPMNVLIPTAAIALLGVCVYNLYRIKLSDLEYKQKLTEMTDKSSK